MRNTTSAEISNQITIAVLSAVMAISSIFLGINFPRNHDLLEILLGSDTALIFFVFLLVCSSFSLSNPDPYQSNETERMIGFRRIMAAFIIVLAAIIMCLIIYWHNQIIEELIQRFLAQGHTLRGIEQKLQGMLTGLQIASALVVFFAVINALLKLK